MQSCGNLPNLPLIIGMSGIVLIFTSALLLIYKDLPPYQISKHSYIISVVKNRVRHNHVTTIDPDLLVSCLQFCRRIQQLKCSHVRYISCQEFFNTMQLHFLDNVSILHKMRLKNE
jgi:hypothetical protein